MCPCVYIYKKKQNICFDYFANYIEATLRFKWILANNKLTSWTGKNKILSMVSQY